METKYKILTGVIIVATAFAAGRYSVPVQVKDEKVKVDTSVVQKDKNTVTHVVTVIKPSGEKVITRDTTEKTETDKKNDIAETETKTVTKETDKFTISALAGIDLGSKSPTYGIGLQKNLIGPIIGGVFGFNTGIYGMSVGLQF